MVVVVMVAETLMEAETDTLEETTLPDTPAEGLSAGASPPSSPYSHLSKRSITAS